jgi:hypothetical protein
MEAASWMIGYVSVKEQWELVYFAIGDGSWSWVVNAVLVVYDFSTVPGTRKLSVTTNSSHDRHAICDLSKCDCSSLPSS